MNKREVSWTSNIIELKEFQKGNKDCTYSDIQTLLKKNKGSKLKQVKARLRLALDFLEDVKLAYKKCEDDNIEDLTNASEKIENFLSIHEMKYDK